jgi:hypothetical protein
VLFVGKLFNRVLILKDFRVFLKVKVKDFNTKFFLSCMKLDEILVVSRKPSKLTPKQYLFNFIFYVKHNNVIKYDAFMWNWCKSTLSDDALFIASCINNALSNEI